MIKKLALTITDITGDVCSSSFSGERTDDHTIVSEEVLADVSPLESPHVLIQGNPVLLTRPDLVEENLKDSENLESLFMDHEPPHEDAIGGILGFGKDVVKDVLTSSAQVHEDKTDKRQDA